ncbi:ubiquinol-cytochrome-c reductase complex assembly factor 2 isoform X5 [Rhagoletis pomonella]|uniref:ubiquinol-cytochrome-c reductase complex assembly factor 2 isoform X5 n=1 Tax=Rhagoletis pomonella TaxID=28610 RepID=UPI00177F7485|nr:ubiquinol-cytochrome-c reductase complex assembly factor 2 isoform X5 [Rhagoletis pomonella]
MSAQYQRFLKALERWPTDKTKVGRDLGERIRKQVIHLANPISLTTEVHEKLSAEIDSLERLTCNVYGKKYQRRYTSTATGLTSEQCNQVLSSEFLQYLNDENTCSPKG